MEQTEERRREIFELQSMLRLIAQMNSAVPLVNPDGIFGPETERAVLAFQQSAGLPPTGIVDFGTWTAITQAYTKALRLTRQGLAFFAFPSAEYEMRLGEKSHLVSIVQIILSDLDIVYDAFDGLPVTGVYDETTENAVRIFQLANRLPETGIVDGETWDRLAEDHNRFAANPIYTS